MQPADFARLDTCPGFARAVAAVPGPRPPGRRDLLVGERRAWVERLELPHAARTQLEVALALIDQLNTQLVPLDRELRQIANSWPGTKALPAHYGIGALTAVAFLAELGDARRFSNSRKAVRYAGLDITVSQSD